MRIKFFAVLMAFLLAGCAAVPESIKVDEQAQLISYQEAFVSPQANADKTVRWGGVIARVKNLPEATMIEMVHYNLRSYGRPIVSNQSVGRFRVYVDGFLDPMVFERGRVVTFAGSFVGVEEGTIGEHNYVFPTMKSAGYHLWKDIDQVEISTIQFWPYQSHYGYGWPYRPVHQRVIIRNSPSNQPSGGSTSPTRQPTRPVAGDSSRQSSGGNVSGNQKEH
ncbi:Slp family lipoprotein [Aliiglaciecola litoralis]|uniref:Slp family lipoprotein n=1 Tax=Aliiglaciecola litoralis TaxID=582857 RepID=A0ABP3WXX7_9ALTE